jgi:hypothetical protein
MNHGDNIQRRNNGFDNAEQLPFDKLNVLLTMHHNISAQYDQRDALFVFSLLGMNSFYMF